MQYRKFGSTDMMVSEIGFGAWAIGGEACVGNIQIGWGATDDKVSVSAIEAAVDAGINFFDTADFYGLGHSEELLGKTLKNKKNILLATKVGQRKLDDRIVLDYSKSYILQACEESLRRLKREAIDYYQLHAARMSHLKEGECIEAMEILRQQGKIRYWGVSLNTFHPEPEADYLMECKMGDGFQLVYNLMNQKAAPVMQRAAKEGYGIIARMPLQFGLLTGKFSSDSSFGETDHRRFRLTPEIIGQSLEILEKNIWPAGQKIGMNKTAMALSFILNRKEISTVIPGIRTKEHVQQNTSGLKPIDKQQQVFFESLYPSYWSKVVDLMEKQG